MPRGDQPAGLVPTERNEVVDPKERGEFTRRQFVGRSGVGIAGAVSAGGLLAACGRSSSAPKGAASTTSSAGSGGPSKPLTAALTADVPSLDIVALSDTTFLLWADLVYERLVRYTESYQIVPLMLTEMPHISADGMTYTLRLRSDITFHNGAPFTSHDVSYTYTVLSKPTTQWKVGPVKSVRTPDKHTVVIELTQPFTYFLDFLALQPVLTASVPYSPAAYGKKMIGSGPYTLEQFVPGQSLELARYKNYRESGPQYIPAITFKILPNFASQLSGLAAGTLQLLPSVPPQYAHTAAQHAVLDVPPRQLNFYACYFNFTPGRPTSNVNLRLAMEYAIDREQIATQVFHGYAKPESTIPGAGNYYYDAAFGQAYGSKPDLAKAKHYLALAGGAPKAALDFPVSNADPNMVAATTIVQQNLKAIGIQTNINLQSPAAILTTLTSHKFDLLGYQGNNEGVAPDFPYFDFRPPNGFGVDFPTFTRTINTAMRAPRGAKAKSAAAQMQKVFTELAPALMLVSASTITAYSHDLHNYRTSNFYDLWPLTSATLA